jgi:uncharacterized membrane protein
VNAVVSSTRALGGVLILVGVVAYVVTQFESVTALLPAFLGVPVLALGLVAGRERARRPAIIAALVLALLGALGTAGNLGDLPALLTGEEVERAAAVVTSAITALLCLIYLVAGVRWVRSGRDRGATTDARG